MPELDVPGISWAACRNPMCKNFGVQFGAGQDDQSNANRSNDCYTLKVSKERTQLQCRYCGQSFTVKANKAIRSVARYFLSMSLPFAACPKRSCPSFGVNVFENYAPPGASQERGSYSKVRDTGVICKECSSSVTLGVALNLQGKDRKGRELREKISRALTDVLTGVRQRRAVWWFRLPPSRYARRLYKVGAIAQSYHSWLNARLFKHDSDVDFSKVARVYTDVMEVPLRRQGDVHRYRPLKIIISVLAIKRTAYVLAFHPYFMPIKFGPPVDAEYYDSKTNLPDAGFKELWDCIEHPAHVVFSFDPKKNVKRFPDVSRWGDGYYIRDSYAELAHFLVIRRMLRRYGRVYYYMDAAPGLIQAAMIGLADDIRKQNAEVVLFQRSTKKVKKPAPPRADMGSVGDAKRRLALLAAWQAREPKVEAVFKAVYEEESNKPKGGRGESFLQAAAHAFRTAARGGFGETGNWAWLRFPAPLGKEREVRTLWLTRMPGKSYKDAEDALAFATLQPVDSVMNAARYRVPALRRAATRASPGRSFARNYVDPLAVLSESAIYFLCRNYHSMSRDSKTIPAQELGLMGKRLLFSIGAPPLPSSPRQLIKVVETFRLGLSHGEKLREWLSH